MADTHLTPEEIKFFETGELQPGMQSAEPPAPPPPPPAPVATAPAAEPAQAPAQPDLHQQQVSLEAAEILRRSLAEANQRSAQLEAAIQQMQSQQKPVDPPAPDPETDPLGAMMHKLESVNKVVADLQNALNAQKSQQDQMTQFQQFQQQVNTLRNEFVKATPDFPAAYDHIRNARIADLRAYGLTDQQVKQALFQEEATLAQNAILQGRNPAEVLYDMAKRHGYTPKPAVPGAPVPPDTKLNAVKNAQSAAQNLPSTPNLEDFTVEGLKGASDADLNKLVSDEKTWAKIVGSDQHPI